MKNVFFLLAALLLVFPLGAHAEGEQTENFISSQGPFDEQQENTVPNGRCVLTLHKVWATMFSNYAKSLDGMLYYTDKQGTTQEMSVRCNESEKDTNGLFGTGYDCVIGKRVHYSMPWDSEDPGGRFCFSLLNKAGAVVRQ